MNRTSSNNDIVSVCRYHVVFYHKYRRKVLVPPIDERLKVIIAEQIDRWCAGLHHTFPTAGTLSHWNQLLLCAASLPAAP
jgi:hypothetical protein